MRKASESEAAAAGEFTGCFVERKVCETERDRERKSSVIYTPFKRRDSVVVVGFASKHKIGNSNNQIGRRSCC